MSWQRMPSPDPYQGHMGLNVGPSAINFPLSTVAELKKRNWEYVTVEYDVHKNMIRLTKSSKGIGYRLTRSKGLSSHVSRHMPTGHYAMYDASDASIMLFNKV